ncbi:MAG: ester cyclase [Chloroflexota bacterium]|nr:ester cyclase [Chloroflexota bacterium]
MTMAAMNVNDSHRDIVWRLVDEVLNDRRLEVIDEIFAPELADEAKRWIAPFQESFPDMRMEVIDLIAEGDRVAGRFTCSATHLGEWLGHPPTGRRFEAVDEVSIFRFHGGRIVETWGIEDNLTRLEQLGLR